ncbi:MAG TPA: DISARM system phospholipase D-like protein DrmC [Candidatus Angelobacter sp.]|nr:DISARM system phospholipase D-like protein DrmC [Candidatus Angelobacter sp.]
MSRPLLSRAPSDLRALAAAIKMGRLSPPFSAVAVKQIVNDDGDAVARSLMEMSDTGMPAAGIASTLELLAATMVDRPRIEDLVQLVATGPQVSGIANRDTSVVVSNLFSQAEKSVLVVGYAVYQGQKVFQSLATRMTERPDLNVKMCLDITRKPGDTSMESELVKRFCYHFRTTQWPTGARLPEIYYDPRSLAVDRMDAASLHAKSIVMDGEHVFISSANFTERGQTKNIELGLILRSQVIGLRIQEFFDRYVAASSLKKAV